ncbi:MAG: amidohydrolase [Bacteroidales bacterium]|nr:amidohydrolase [Bacteroidales bacterium]
MKHLFIPLLVFVFLGLNNCNSKKINVDLIVHNAAIYTVNEQFSIEESMALSDGKIVAVGTNKDILDKYLGEKTIDLDKKFILPGLIDAHCHYYGYGMNLNNVDLVGTTSFEEIIEKTKSHYQQFPSEWILGRGWDQNDWEVKEFPTREKLDLAFPDTPVFLRRIDGHGAIANAKALELAGVTKNTKIDGGDLILKDGELTGVLIDNAMGLVGRVIPANNRNDIINGLLKAQENCFEVGLTTVFDAGLGNSVLHIIDSLQAKKQLKMRINAMLSPSKKNFTTYLYNGIYQTDLLTIRSIKLFADGALGSRGAKLLYPYSDDPGNSGLLVSHPDDLMDICEQAYEYGYQVNTHCIGDSANRLMLNIYGEILKGKNDKRWRIEHAQIIHPDDFKLFGKYSLVPSIQSTHATSDMYWAEDRLGAERIKGAYAYRQLLEQNGWIPNGSDFPVEHINPLFGFFALTARKDQSGYPENGFQMENSLSREEALKAMTIWAAKSGFEEDRIGSIEPGKYADFIVIDINIMDCDLMQIPKLQIQKTFVQGVEVFSAR